MERHTRIGHSEHNWRAQPVAQGRNPAPAESQARYRRHGPTGRNGVPQLIWEQGPRNGMPVRFYVYRGRGPFAWEEEAAS